MHMLNFMHFVNFPVGCGDVKLSKFAKLEPNFRCYVSGGGNE